MNTIIAIKEYDNVFYAEPFEQLGETVQTLMTNGQNYFILFALIVTITTILVQCALFYWRNKEYRTYLLLNERKSMLSHQITLEQLILMNAALVVLLILFFLLHSLLGDFFSNLETSMIIQHEPAWRDTSIQSLSGSHSILDQSGFTRFHIRPFLIGTAKNEIFKPVLREYIPLLFITLNLVAYILIYVTNYLLIQSKKISRSFLRS